MRVDLVGVFPPPLGGISVHLSRLASRLASAGVEVHRHGPQLAPPFFGYYERLLRATRGADVVHAHLHGPLDLAMLGLLARTCRRMILTVHAHNVAGAVLAGRPARAAVVGASLRSMAAVVCVNPMIAKEIRAVGVRAERIVHAPAFLPPDREALLAEAPEPRVARFIARHHPVLSANAFTFDLYDGRLLYGQDLLVDALTRLVPLLPRVGLVVHVAKSEGAGAARLREVAALAAARGVADHILWVEGSRPFGPTLVRSGVMLRPTATDGDAVSVREALHLGVPVVASDVVERPTGARVFALDDPKALTARILEALALPERARHWPQPDPFPRLLELYRKVGGSAVAGFPSM